MPEYHDPELRAQLAALDGEPRAGWVDAERERLAAAWESGKIEPTVKSWEVATMITEPAVSTSTRSWRRGLFVTAVAAAVVAAIVIGGVLVRDDTPKRIIAGPTGGCAGKAYVTNYFAGTVSAIDTTTGKVAAAVRVGAHPVRVAIAPDGKHAYVTVGAQGDTNKGKVAVIDTATDKVSATITVAAGLNGIAVSPDGKQLYVTGGKSPRYAGLVFVIDTATGKVSATIPVGRALVGLAVTPDGKHVYVPSGYGAVSVIDTATDQVSATIHVGNVLGEVAITPDGTRAYVSGFIGTLPGGTVSKASTVSVIDTETGSVSATIPVGKDSSGVAITPDGKHVYAPNYADGTMSVIDTTTDKVSATIPKLGSPSWVAITPDGTHAYVSNYRTVSVIDTATDKVSAAITTGSQPGPVAICPAQRA
jgi:YVTN family beta-propeller protein